MNNIYLDSNFFITLLEKRKADTKTKCHDFEANEEILKRIETGKLSAFTSWYTLSELINRMKRRYCEEHKELQNNEVEYDPIPEETRKKIVDIAMEFLKIQNLKIIGSVRDELAKSPAVVANVCIDHDDAFHFILAENLHVACIITEDKRFRKRANRFIKSRYPNEFISF